MIKIKNIVFIKNFDIIKFINYLLPLRLKFLSETFVVLENGKDEGLITLEKDSKSATRFKITQLILEKYSLAHQLTNYAISRYRAMGATSFYAVVDEKQADLINVFQNELNFRLCGCEYLYEIKKQNTDYSNFLKTYKKENVKEVSALYNENINSYNRFLFMRENYQFQNKMMKYIFYNDDRTKVLGYFEIATKNCVDYYTNFVIDCGYNIYILDAIKFIYAQIKRKTKKFHLYVKVKDYFLNSKDLITILNENNAELVSKSSILAKDYYKEIKNESLFKNAKIIFNDPTIA